MMVDGAEEGQFRGPIDVLVPYTQCKQLSSLLSLLRATGAVARVESFTRSNHGPDRFRQCVGRVTCQPSCPET